jgi:hypothetical protein
MAVSGVGGGATQWRQNVDFILHPVQAPGSLRFVEEGFVMLRELRTPCGSIR